MSANQDFTFWSQHPFEGIFTAASPGILAPPHQQPGWWGLSWDSQTAHLLRGNAEFVTPLNQKVASQVQPLLVKAIQAANASDPLIMLTLLQAPSTQCVLWGDVPYMFQDPLKHPLDAQLVRIHATLHADPVTPAAPFDGATISLALYVFVRLENGHLKGDVDGAWIIVDGGFPITGLIADQMKAQITTIMNDANDGSPGLASQLSSLIAKVSPAVFGSLYLVPGDGQIAPMVSGDCTQSATLVLALPQ